ncbi:MAG: radical SAM protein [Planctomycetaceae bacterium]|nr:radical SAM protein [Planctomycetaceae bacterium]
MAGRPVRTLLILEPTLQCNSRCRTCYNRDKLNTRGAVLSLEAIERIAEALPNLLVLELSGGEPFLHPQLVEMIDAFAARTSVRIVSVPTNGLATNTIVTRTREILQTFRGELAVGLSIDAIAQRHDEIRGVEGNFEALCRTYDALAALKGQHPRLHISANTCISSYNAASYRDVQEWVEQHWPLAEGHSLSLARSVPAGETAVDAVDFLSREGAHLARSGRRRKGYRLGIVGRLNSMFWGWYYRQALRHHRGLPRQWACSAGRGSLYINALGQVHACEMLEPIGSLTDPPAALDDVLNSARALAQCRTIASRGCSCDHSCFMQHSAFTMPGNITLWLRGVLGGGKR